MPAQQSAARSNDVLETALRSIPEGAFRDRVRTQFLAIVTQSACAAPELRPTIIKDAAVVLARHLREAGSDEDHVDRTITTLFGKPAHKGPSYGSS